MTPTSSSAESSSESLSSASSASMAFGTSIFAGLPSSPPAADSSSFRSSCRSSADSCQTSWVRHAQTTCPLVLRIVKTAPFWLLHHALAATRRMAHIHSSVPTFELVAALFGEVLPLVRQQRRPQVLFRLLRGRILALSAATTPGGHIITCSRTAGTSVEMAVCSTRISSCDATAHSP